MCDNQKSQNLRDVNYGLILGYEQQYNSHTNAAISNYFCGYMKLLKEKPVRSYEILLSQLLKAALHIWQMTNDKCSTISNSLWG